MWAQLTAYREHASPRAPLKLGQESCWSSAPSSLLPPSCEKELGEGTRTIRHLHLEMCPSKGACDHTTGVCAIPWAILGSFK